MTTTADSPTRTRTARTWTLWVFQVDDAATQQDAYASVLEAGLGATTFQDEAAACLAINTDDISDERLLQRILSQVTPTARMRGMFRPMAAS